MLPLEKLDDRSFQDIVENARKRISRLNPEWTDENYSDPGITMLELFAWLTEIQQYRLDRVTGRNELKFLRMLGEKPADTAPAETVRSVSGARGDFILPVGTQLTSGNLVFETERSLSCHPLAIERLLAVTGRDIIDFSEPNRYSKYGYPAFGKDAGKGDRMLIGLSGPVPEGSGLSIYLDLFDDYPVPCGEWHEGESEFLPSGRLSWQYYGRNEKGASWLPLKILRDETIQMSRDGILEAAVDFPMEPVKIDPANDKPRYWLRCEVIEAGFEIAPRLNQIVLNAVHAEQKETLSRQEVFWWDGGKHSSFLLKNFLQYYGTDRVQVQDEAGNWAYWNEEKEGERFSSAGENGSLERNPEEKTVRLKLGGAGSEDGQTNRKIRVISYLPGFEEKRMIGRSCGLPGQTFFLPKIFRGARELLIQIGSRTTGGRSIWRDWTRVEDFDASGPDDRHFVLDTEKWAVCFGDDEHGAVPEASETDNICVLSCFTTAGAAGNIRENNSFRFRIGEEETRPVKVENIQKAAGGRDAESIESARERLLGGYFKTTRAVTARDYETLARETPGARIACAKAIPGFSPDIPGFPEKKTEGHVTVVVVPFSDRDRPMPSRNLLRNVQRYLEENRLIGTQIHVMPPEYAVISVRAVLVVRIRDFDKRKVFSVIRRMLEPFDRESGRYTWDFRHTLFKSDILSLLNQVPGVEYVSGLSLRAESGGGRVTAAGDVALPPYGLPVAGPCEIEVKDVTEQ